MRIKINFQLKLAEKESILQRNKDWYKNNRDQIRAYNKDYKKSHRDQIKANQKSKRNSHEPYRLQTCIQTILYRTLRDLPRPGTAKDIIGCSWDDFAAYLHQRKLLCDNSWNTEHTLHIDHVIPRRCPFFDFNNPDHIRACFHYTNSQYLPKHLNHRKSNTLPPGFDQHAFDLWLQKQLAQIDKIHKDNLSHQTVLSQQQSGNFQ